MQGDVCKNGINLKHIVAITNDISENDVNAHLGKLGPTISKFIDDDVIKMLKNDAKDLLGPETIEFLMNVLDELENGSGRELRTADFLDMVRNSKREA